MAKKGFLIMFVFVCVLGGLNSSTKLTNPHEEAGDDWMFPSQWKKVHELVNID